MENWDVPQVIEWLNKVNLERLVSLFEMEKVDGVCLRELATLLSRDFSLYQNSMQNFLKIESYSDILRLAHNLRKLN